MADEDQTGGEGGGQATESTQPASKDRPYGVFSEETLELKGDDKELLEQIKKHLPDDAKEAVILVRVGKAVEKDPKGAIQALGGFRDLDGDYVVIADNSRNEFKGVKSELKRSVSIG